MAKITTHPSAAGERLRAARAAEERERQYVQQQQQRQATPTPEEPAAELEDDVDDDDFAQVLLDRRSARRRAPGRAKSLLRRIEPQVRKNVTRFRPRRPEPEENEPSPRTPRIGADLRSRVVTGVLIAAVALLILDAGTGPAAFLSAVVIGLGVIELSAALRSAAGYRPAVIPALVGSVALVLGTYNNGLSAYASVTALVVMASLAWYLFQVVPSPPVAGLASTLFVYGYVGGLGGFAGLVLGFADGIGILLGLVLCVVANDIAAYFGGRRFGRRPLTAISPNKTVEGFLAGAAGSLLVGVVLVGSIAPWDRPSALFLGLVIALLAPLGDICESMIKRDLGVKDLGGILPGHGGVLDRFDAILFCLPAVYYLVRLLDLA
jgi:CDP-diglyceride synthetase